jgi:hypothetical protein
VKAFAFVWDVTFFGADVAIVIALWPLPFP